MSREYPTILLPGSEYSSKFYNSSHLKTQKSPHETSLYINW